MKTLQPNLQVAHSPTIQLVATQFAPNASQPACQSASTTAVDEGLRRRRRRSFVAVMWRRFCLWLRVGGNIRKQKHPLFETSAVTKTGKLSAGWMELSLIAQTLLGKGQLAATEQRSQCSTFEPGSLTIWASVDASWMHVHYTECEYYCINNKSTIITR